ncbi:hypothetical protein AAFF_G00347810 [Aldrovandia affinis]|uniref:Uncharacterized protein n=1 Tax=Aldrovandia affinis TaxID=143900 RepID=A0AAD7SJZ0_9TELE|nr:hypothetical protein AAFF_G00347810 [Aldrovandia affinis]
MSAFLFLIVVAVGVYFVWYHTVIKGAWCKSQAKLHGKTVIVTGANTGIGKATALDLARRGARMILACRSKARAEAAVFDIRRESGNNEVVYMLLDLASLKSVRSFAENFLKTEPRLDLLINNAGIFMQGRTEDGLGMMFSVNHLGHFLLSNLLLERLEECGPSRVVTVSSVLHRAGSIDFTRLNAHKDLGVGESYLDMLKIYSHTKLCNVFFTRELAKRLQGTSVTCYSLHPGQCEHTLYSTCIYERGDQYGAGPSQLPVNEDVARAHHDARPPTAPLQEGIKPFSGRYFSSCAVQEVSAKARDDAVARKLWEVSETLSGLS